MGNKIERSIDLSGLPRWGDDEEKCKAKKGSINWAKCMRYKIPFTYDDIHGHIEILDYIDGKLKVQWNNRVETYFIKHIMGCNLGRLLGKVTNEFKVKIGTHFKDDKRDLIITDRNKEKHIKDNGDCYNKKTYKYTCNKCGWKEGWIEESNLLKGKGCPACCHNPQIVVEGINDIPTTAPWMIPYFQGGYKEAKLYTKSSNKKIIPVCNICGRIKSKPLKISDIYRNHGIGCECSDNISYPEKIMFSVLSQLGVEFETQYNIKWSNTKRYDFYIEYLNTIIETHGIQHYQDFGWGRGLKKEQKNDKLKEKLAKENNIKNYIIIDCRYSEIEFIKNNILNSELNNLFDLSKIDWVKCNKFALNSLIKEVCDYWNNKENDVGIEYIANIFKLNRCTIREFLKRGSEIELCEYNSKDETNKGLSIGRINKRKPIEIFKNEVSLGVFESAKYLSENSIKLFGIFLHQSAIGRTAKGEQDSHHGYTFRYVNPTQSQSA